MSWYYEKSGQPVGPVEDGEFERLLTQGELRSDTLVWREGQAGWLPLQQVRPMASPAAAPAPAAPAQWALATPVAGQVQCASCGMSYPPDQVVVVAGAPVCAVCKTLRLQRIRQGESGGIGMICRDRKNLIVPLRQDLPERCVKCNATEGLTRYKRTLYWHNQLVFLALLFNVLVYLIIALIVRKKAVVGVCLCATHVSKRRLRIGLAWGCFVACLGSTIGIAAFNGPDYLWILPPVLLIASIVLAVLSRMVYAAKITETELQMAGCEEPFLKTFPTVTGK